MMTFLLLQAFIKQIVIFDKIFRKNLKNHFMKVSYVIMLVSLAVLLGACSDQTSRTHTISGKVFAKDDMQPMSNILLSVYQDNGKEGFQTDILGGNQLTAADGGFAFAVQPFKNGEATNILVTSSANTTINLGFSQQSFNFPIVFEEIPIEDVLEDEDFEIDLIGEPFGFLEIEFIGNTSLFVDDGIVLEISADGYSYKTDLTVAENLNQVYSYPVRGGARTEVKWEARLSGITRTDSDSVFCRKEERTKFTIAL